MAAFQDLTACVEAVSDHLQHLATLDREVINALWGVCHDTRAWALV